MDMFMGSGSTGVACIYSEKNFIGMEIDEEYYKKAVERIEETQKQIFIGEIEEN